MNPGLSIIIPVYNEAENIAALCSALDCTLSGQQDLAVDVIFVNDGSTDATEARLRGQTFSGYRAKLVRLSRNFGSHAALRAGVFHARTEHVAFLYADLQETPELVLELYRKAREGYDIVWAERTASATQRSGAFFSGVYVWLMKRFVFRDFPEYGFDVMLFNSKVTRELNRNIESNSSIFLQVLGMGFSQASVPFQRRDRTAGHSKWSWADKVKLLVDSFVAFSYAPIRFVTVMGILFFIAGICWTVYISTRKLVYDDLLEGWPILTSILLLGFGLTNIALGVIAEYLWRTLDASRNRPVFIIDEAEDLHNAG